VKSRIATSAALVAALSMFGTSAVLAYGDDEATAE
jgi:hypothetical protein